MRTRFQQQLWALVLTFAAFMLITAVYGRSAVVAQSESTPEPTVDLLACNARWYISSVAFSPDSQTLLSSWSVGQARLWDIQTGEVIRTFYSNPDNDVTSVAFSPDGSIIATADSRQAILWDAQSGEQLHTLVRELQNDFATQIIFTPNSEGVLTSGYDGATLWDVKSGEKLRSFPGLQDTLLGQYTHLSSDGEYILTSDLRHVYVWDVESGRKVHTFENQEPADFTPDGNKIVTLGNNAITLWDVNSFEQIVTLSPVYGRPRWALSQNGHYLLTKVANEDGYGLRLVLWDTETGKQLETKPDLSTFDILLQNDNGFSLDSLFPEDDLSIIHMIRNINLGSIIKTISLENIDVLQSQISPNGELWAVGTVEGTLEVWSLENGQKLGDFC